MKISRKQLEEIDFLTEYINNDINSWEKINARQKGLPEPVSNYSPSQEEKEEYIQSTVLGNKKLSPRGIGGSDRNKLFDAKRGLDITIKMWRKYLVDGIVSIDELYEGFSSSVYGKNLIDSVLKSLVFKKVENPRILTLYNALKKYEKDSRKL